MISPDEKVKNIEQILNDVSERVKKLDEDISHFKSGFRDVGDVEDVEEETVTTPTPSSDVKEWVTNRDIKFDDSKKNAVKLSFDRIMKLLNIQINKGDKNKPWGLIQSNLIGANSMDEIKKVIKENELIFSNNLIMGGRRTRRMRRGRITKRRVKNNKKTRSHKKARSHKKRH